MKRIQILILQPLLALSLHMCTILWKPYSQESWVQGVAYPDSYRQQSLPFRWRSKKGWHARRSLAARSWKLGLGANPCHRRCTTRQMLAHSYCHQRQNILFWRLILQVSMQCDVTALFLFWHDLECSVQSVAYLLRPQCDISDCAGSTQAGLADCNLLMKIAGKRFDALEDERKGQEKRSHPIDAVAGKEAVFNRSMISLFLIRQPSPGNGLT